LISLVLEFASEEWHQHSDRQCPDLLIFLSSFNDFFNENAIEEKI